MVYLIRVFHCPSMLTLLYSSLLSCGTS
jgi:hypothetical protein